MRAMLDAGRAPTAAETAAALGLATAEAEQAYRDLAASHAFELHPGTLDVWMVHPLSAVPTPYVATVNGRDHYANCIWDGLGAVALCRHRDFPSVAAGEALDREQLAARNAQGRRRVSLGELERNDPHHEQVRAVNPLVVGYELQAEELLLVGVPVGADPLEDGRPVVEAVRHDVDVRLAQRDELTPEERPQLGGRLHRRCLRSTLLLQHVGLLSDRHGTRGAGRSIRLRPP